MRFRLEHAASAMRSLAGAGERAVLVLLNGTFLKMMMPECCFLEFKFGEVMLMLMRMLPSVSFKSLSRVQACLLFESSAVSTVQALQTLWDDLLGSLNEFQPGGLFLFSCYLLGLSELLLPKQVGVNDVERWL